MLALVAGLMLILILIAALAVDLSALSTRGRTLQNSADAASLAGVAVWAETGDQAATQVAIEDVLRQNGVDLAAGDVSVQIRYLNPWEIDVLLIDNDPDVFFSGAVGIGNDLERGAQARFESCDDSCSRVVPIPPPFTAVESTGAGDGFEPIILNDKVYGVNHHGRTIACISVEDSSDCWSSSRRDAFLSRRASTANQADSAVIGNNIYYSGWDHVNSRTVVACWNTITDTICGETWFASDDFPQRYAATAAVNNQVFVLSENGAVFCLNTDLSSCNGYPASQTVLSEADLRWTGAHDVGFDRNFAQGYFSDVLTEGNRIFHVIESQGQEWLQCWDASIGDACWDARVANNSPILYAGDDGILLRANGSRDGNPQNIRNRTANNAVLVVNRNTDGDATAICSLGLRNVECHDIATGSPASGAALDGLRDNWNTGNNWAFWPASPEYHEPTNRVFLADPNGRVRVTYCHDFNTGMTCDIPSINNPSSFGQAQTYTYTTASEDCLIGLAHNQIFTSLSADMSGVCTSTGTSVDITPCVCGGEVAWPPLGVLGTEQLEEFQARVYDPRTISESMPLGTQIIPEPGADGEDDPWFDLLTGTLDLGEVSTDVPFVTIEMRVVASPDADPWSNPEPPAFSIGITDRRPGLTN